MEALLESSGLKTALIRRRGAFGPQKARISLIARISKRRAIGIGRINPYFASTDSRRMSRDRRRRVRFWDWGIPLSICMPGTPRSGARQDLILLANSENGTGSGSDLVDSGVAAYKAPGRYRSLYRTNSPAVSDLATAGHR